SALPRAGYGLPRLPASEDQSDRELDDARVARTGYFAERRVGLHARLIPRRRRVDLVELCVVEHVVGLAPELCLQVAREVDVLEQGEIRVHDAGAAAERAPGISEREHALDPGHVGDLLRQRGWRENQRVEPLGAVLPSGKIRVARDDGAPAVAAAGD